MLADDPRPGEKEEKLLLLNLQHLVVLLRHHVDVIASANDELLNLPKKIWRRRSHGTADDSVQGRLHRPGWNLERLQEIRADSHRDDNGDQNDFDIFAPVRFPRDRRELMQFG